MSDDPELVDYRGHAVPPGDRAQLLRDRLEVDYPAPWKPAPGETITGVFARIEHGWAKHAKECAIMVLADPTTRVETSVWLMHAALKAKLAKERPAIGELVAIKYLGISESSDAAMYRVTVDRPTGASVDWDRIGGGLSAGGGASVETDEPDASAGNAGPEADIPRGAVERPSGPPAESPSLSPCEICKWTNAHQPGCPNAVGDGDDIPF